MADKGGIAFPAILVVAAVLAMTQSNGSDEPSSSSADDGGSSSSSAEPSTRSTPADVDSSAVSGDHDRDADALPAPPDRVEGVDPESTVCADYARTVQGKNATYEGKVYARVELRYSPVCRASWVRTLGSAGEQGNPVATWGQIVRPSDGTVRATEHCSSTFCWSDMVDVAGRTAYAQGGFDYGSVDVKVRTRRY